MPFAIIFFSRDAELPGRVFIFYSRQLPLSEYYGVLGQKQCFVRTADKKPLAAVFPNIRQAGRSALPEKKQGQRVCLRKKGRRVIGAFFIAAAAAGVFLSLIRQRC